MNKLHIPRIPKGCDQQGRHPEAAHAADESDDRPAGGGWFDFAWAVTVSAAILFVLGILWGWGLI